MTADDRKVLVLGVGNPLMADEGVGPRVIEELRSRYLFPEFVDILDAGTMGLSMLGTLKGVDYLIVVDAIQNSEHAPGTVLQLSADDIAPNTVRHSMHDQRLIDLLQSAALLGIEPETTCVAIQVASMEEWTLELTPAVEAAVPHAAAAVLGLLAARGITPVPLEGSVDADADVIRLMRTRGDGNEDSSGSDG